MVNWIGTTDLRGLNVKAPEFEMKHLKKVGGYIGRNVMSNNHKDTSLNILSDEKKNLMILICNL